MSEFFSEVAEEFTGVAETGLNATEGVVNAAEGDWEGAADSSLSMSESALGVATGGVSELVEQGWDAIAEGTGLPDSHELLSEGTQAAGEAVGDGLFGLVGEEHAYRSAQDFDDGDILGGLGEMAEGAGETIADGAVDLAEDIADGAASVAGDIADGAASVAGDIADGAEELWDEITD